jgi:hypothetical protein
VELGLDGLMQRRAGGVERSDVIGPSPARNCEVSAAGLSCSGTSAVFTACLGDRGTFYASRLVHPYAEVRSLLSLSPYLVMVLLGGSYPHIFKIRY